MYDHSLAALTAISVVAQLLSLPVFVAARGAATPPKTR
jgi:hypothetical protein